MKDKTTDKNNTGENTDGNMNIVDGGQRPKNHQNWPKSVLIWRKILESGQKRPENPCPRPGFLF